ncbi:MAG: N-acetylmuramoyl-L-alanine amidase, partial [Duncaniella sp.]|nr:N-acetylmuramoyl-L-alanine amidase [Duncaniella sp.]
MSLTRIIRLLLVFLLFSAFSSTVEGKDFTVVIDPGHGGKDAGALGRKTNEKTINLGVAKRLRDLINANMSDADVLMTRSNDTFVTLQGRADIANRKHADIFISIHANSLDKKSTMFTSVNGADVYTLGLKRSDTNLT